MFRLRESGTGKSGGPILPPSPAGAPSSPACRTTPPQLFLIDGYALIYRAFFALITRPLRTTRGENTSAAWGVVNFLLRLREKYQPDYLAWVHDAGDSFRTALYPEYKSTREKLDEELQADFDRSVERIEQLLAAFRVPVVSGAGLRGGRRHRHRWPSRESARGLAGGHRLGRQGLLPADRPAAWRCSTRAAAARRRWTSSGWTSPTPPSGSACRPRQVVDYLALVGDASDNVPGVKGIGSKGAVGAAGSSSATSRRCWPGRPR